MRWKGEKAKAWEKVKQYNRAREKVCYTCGKQNLFGIDSQSGHYRTVAVVGSNNTRCWDDRFIHLQCSRCNGAGAGEQAKYKEHLIVDYGIDVVAEYDRLVDAKAVSPIKNWEEIIEHYSKLLQDLSAD